MAEYISIADFAEKAGVTKQAVYSRIGNKEFEKFIKVVEGKKLIDISAIKFFKAEKNYRHLEQEENTLNQELVTALRQQIESLQEENRRLHEDKEYFKQLIDRANQALDQSQRLQAQSQMQLVEARAEIKMLQEAKQEEPVVTEECKTDVDGNQEKKKGFFSWLFD